MAKTRPPKIPDKPVPVLPDDDVRHLLADCSGKDFRDRRDLAIIRLFLDNGMRLEGMAGLRYSAGDPEGSDVDLRSRVVRITAKGRRELVLPIGAKSARDIDRYIRMRAGHPRAADQWLWLGTKGRLTASGVYQMIKDRGAAAGLPDLHPHQLRHTFSHDWLANGGSEGDLMRLAGWKSRAMLTRYAASAATNERGTHTGDSPPATDSDCVSILPDLGAAAGLAGNLYRRTSTAKDARRAARRFLSFEDPILRFATRPDLDIFSNNEAERTIRPVKVQQRSSGGCWRALDGLAEFALVQSYLSTARTWGIRKLDALRSLLNGSAWLPPGLEPAG